MKPPGEFVFDRKKIFLAIIAKLKFWKLEWHQAYEGCAERRLK